MPPVSERTVEETAQAYAGLHLHPHEKTAPNFAVRAGHTHAAQQAVNVPNP